MWTGSISDEAMKEWLIEAQDAINARFHAMRACQYYRNIFKIYEQTGNILLAQGREFYVSTSSVYLKIPV